MDVITNYTDTTAGAVDRNANNTKVYFSKDYVFKTTGLAQCDPNGPAFSTSTTEDAKIASAVSRRSARQRRAWRP